MSHASAIAALSVLSSSSLGMFRGSAAVDGGVSRKQLAALSVAGVIERVLPDTYRMTAVRRSSAQRLHGALLWGGIEAAGAGRSAGEVYGLEGVHAPIPEIVVPSSRSARSDRVTVHHYANRTPLLLRRHSGVPATGVEPTLVSLAAVLDDEELEVACEDARRRRLTSIPALRSYLDRHGRVRRAGVGTLRGLVAKVDPVHASRSTLEVKARRLLVAHGVTDFIREFPLEWNGRTYLYDFAFDQNRTILETNGRRWHDDADDYEHDNEKWSVPARHGYRIVFPTWDKVTRHRLQTSFTNCARRSRPQWRARCRSGNRGANRGNGGPPAMSRRHTRPR